MTTYVYQVGDTIRLPLLLEEGDRTLVSNVRANLKKTVGNKQTPALSVAAVAVFTVLESTLGWILEIPASVSATLAPGLYVTNAALDVSGTTIITDPSYIKLEPSTIV